MRTFRFISCLLISITTYTYSHAASEGTVSEGQVKSGTCQGCHGPDGNSFSPDWPNLAAQNANYLAKQIRDFQSGARKDPTMSSMVIGLGEQDIADIAAYFETQKVVADAASQSATGQKLYMGGDRYSHLPSCASCHGPNGAGNGPGAIPSLAGQKAGYTIKTLQDFKSKARNNGRNGIMQDIAAKMTDQEMTAVATFLAGMGGGK
jgi:cytochrome c553